MIHVAFSLPALDGDPALDDDAQRWWRAWLGRAEMARAAFIEARRAGAEPDFKSDVWKELKDWLFEHPFRGKCGYCESDVSAVDYGDAEHYRPKGAVTEGRVDSRMPVVVRKKLHEGYWWLAYDWENLFPACGKCNSANKREHFPTENAHVRPLDRDVGRWSSAALDLAERPLLLHPMRVGAENDPERHITFDVDCRAIAVDSSARAQATIETCGLNRSAGSRDLLTRRKRIVDLALVMCAQHFEKSAYSFKAVGEWMRAYAEEGGEYVGAVRAAVRAWHRRIIEQDPSW